MAASNTRRKTTASRSRTGAKSNTRKTAKKKQTIPVHSMCILINTAISILLVIFMFVDSSGMVNNIVKTVLLGLFGKTAYLIPFVSVATTVYVVKTRDAKRFQIKAVLAFVLLVNMSAIIHLLTKNIEPIATAYSYGIDGIGGGFLGGAVGVGLYMLFKRAASVVILFFSLFVLISIATKVSVFSAVWTYIKGLFVDVRDEIQDVKHVDNYEKGVRAKEAIVQHTKKRKQGQVFDLPIDIGTDKQFDEKMLALEHAPNKKAAKMAEEEAVPVYSEPEDVIDMTSIEGIFGSEEETAVPEEIDRMPERPIPEAVFDSPEPEEDIEYTEAFDSSTDFMEEAQFHAMDREKPQETMPEDKVPKLDEAEKVSFSEELSKAIERPVVDYVFPTVDLLSKTKSSSTDLRREMRETAAKLIEVLKNFGVEAKLLQVTQGPSVTRYEIQPNTGIKLSKIVGLADDIALNLAASNVLVAAVPGKAAVGIEVPNKEVSSVSMRDLIESEEFKNSKSKLSAAFGKDIGGRVVVGDIAKMPHVLIAGATGSGKSVCINTVITSILYKAKPDEVKLIMVDPKVVELGVYNGIPHLLIPVVTDPKKAAGALNWAVAEMMKRYDLFAQTGVRNLEGYNKIMEKSGDEKIPQILIIIDELADLMMVAAKEVEDYVCRLAQLARAAGIHLIIATQRPSVDVITGLIKANIPSRIALSVSSQVDSRTIIDKGGAEKLLGKGDMLYYPAGARNPMRVQGAFVSDGEIENIVSYLKDTGENSSYSEDLAEHIERCATGENGVTPDEADDGDELLPTAIELAVELGQISTAMIQRRLKVGYSRAGRIIDQMEARGIISGANGSKPRQVYMSHSDLADRQQE